MKDITAVETLDIPEGVTVNIKARKVTVEGPRGTITKSANHVQMDIQQVSLAKWCCWSRVGLVDIRGTASRNTTTTEMWRTLGEERTSRESREKWTFRGVRKSFPLVQVHFRRCASSSAKSPQQPVQRRIVHLPYITVELPVLVQP